jgi:diguanylate cyclase (GGDEF)-like protein/PAS domain S-box-containing protein
MRFIQWTRIWPVLTAVLFGTFLTFCGYLAWQGQDQRKIADHARFDASEYGRVLRERMQTSVQLDRNVAGLFSASDKVTSREFETFIRNAQTRGAHPGLGYIGYLPRVANSRIPQFVAEARRSIPGYAIHGSHRDADAVYPLLYAVPSGDTVRRFLGFDYATVAERWEAMQKAAESGESVATRKMAYLSAPSREDYVFIFTPVYAASMPLETPAQRRGALSGFVFSVFRIEDLVEGIMGAGFKQRFDLEIYDGELKREHLLYDGDHQPHAIEGGPTFASHGETIDFASRRWILYFQPKAFYAERHGSRNGWLILLCGALGSTLLAWLTWKWQQRRRALRLQSDHAQRFHAVFEHHPSAVFSLDTQWRFTNANTQALRQLEASRGKLLDTSLLKLVAAEDAERVRRLLDDALASVSVRFDCTLVGSAGKRIDVSIVLIPVLAAGRVSSVLGIADNVTERRQSEWRLEESRQMLQLVIDNIPQRVFWKDTELYFLGCNKAFCADAGLDDPRQIVGKTDSDFAWKDEAEGYRQGDLQTMQSGVAKINYEEAQHRQDGTLNWLRTSKIPLTDAQGHTVGVLGMYEDITERKLVEQRLEHMALYDGLTGLPNRSHFLARLEGAIEKATRDGSLTGLMYFDIDKFKRINDSFGHDVGDEVIAEFAARVTATIRETDVVGRLGGDEFCLLLESLPDAQAAQKLASKLIDAMRPAMQIGAISLQVGTSMGIAYHRPGISADDMIRCADQAMYRAKQAGGNRFSLAQDDETAQPEESAAGGSLPFAGK